jgi:hypothetical protein
MIVKRFVNILLNIKSGGNSYGRSFFACRVKIAEKVSLFYTVVKFYKMDPYSY